MAKIGTKFKSMLNPTRHPTKSPTYAQKVERQVGKSMYKKHPSSTVGKRYHEAVKRAGRLKRRRIVAKGIEKVKSDFYRPEAVSTRRSIARSFKKGGRKVLRKLL